MNKKIYDTFDFTGEIVIPESTDDFYVVDQYTTSSKARLVLGVRDEDENSTAFVKLEAWLNNQGNPIRYKRDLDGNTIDVAWNDRMNESVLRNIQDFSKTIVDIETDFEKKEAYDKKFFSAIRMRNNKDGDMAKADEYLDEFYAEADNRYEFLSEIDLLDFLREQLPRFQDTHKIRIRGNVELDEYKGKIYRNFVPSTIELVDKEKDSSLKATLNIYFSQLSMDESSFRDTKKIYLNGYLYGYDKNSEYDKRSYFPQQFVINASKFDMENDKHKKILDYIKGKFAVRGRDFYYQQCEISVFNGADILSGGDDAPVDLTPEQQIEVDLGISKPEDFATGQKNFGERYTELRIVKPVTKNIFSNGALETGLKDEEFMKRVVKSSESITTDEALNGVTEKKAKEAPDKGGDVVTDLDKELEDLLG